MYARAGEPEEARGAEELRPLSGLWRPRLPPGDGGDGGMVWDASAGAVRASYWRTTVDEYGHTAGRGVRQPAPQPHEAQQCRARKGWMRLPARALVPRFRPRSTTSSASQPSSRGLAALAPSLPRAPAERDKR